MAAWSFPDGCSVGAFDGRQTTSFGFGVPVCPGLELTPSGRALNARSLQTHADHGLAEAGVRGSAWYEHFSTFLFATALRYVTELLTPAERAQAADDQGLPADVDGIRQHHSGQFDALRQRRGPWCVALSSQNSQVPRQAPSIFRLERASRIEIWHERARLVLGGGHNRKDWPVPYANAVLDTGFAGETQFGLIEPETHANRRSYYLPIAAESDEHGGAAELALHFAHGSVWFLVQPGRDEIRIAARWDIRRVARLCLQLPLVVWRGADLRLDGATVRAGTPSLTEVERKVAAIGSPHRSAVTLHVPPGVPARVHYPLSPLRYYVEPVVPDSSHQVRVISDR